MREGFLWLGGVRIGNLQMFAADLAVLGGASLNWKITIAAACRIRRRESTSVLSNSSRVAGIAFQNPIWLLWPRGGRETVTAWRRWQQEYDVISMMSSQRLPDSIAAR